MNRSLDFRQVCWMLSRETVSLLNSKMKEMQYLADVGQLNYVYECMRVSQWPYDSRAREFSQFKLN